MTATAQPETYPVVYRSRIGVEPAPHRSKWVTLPAEPERLEMGFQAELADHFGLVEGTFTPHASTLDYLVAATAACMTGVFTAAMRARQIPVDDGLLRVEAVGEVELEDVLVLRRIHLVIHLRAAESHRPAAERVAATFESQCPVYRSIHTAVAITSELDFESIAEG